MTSLYIAAWLLFLVALAPKPTTADPTPAGGHAGRVLYARYCAACHGSTGRGDGPDATLFDPRPLDLHAGVLQRYSVGDVARRVRTGRQLTLAVDVDALRKHASDVEEIVAHMKRLPSVKWEVVNSGWDRYVDRCERCHGPTGQPTKVGAGVKPPRDLSDPSFQQSTDNDSLIETIRHGRKGMPALTPRISIDEGRQIAAFVTLLSPGFRLYSRYCTNCHADDGRGAQSLGEVLGDEIALPAIVFDREYFARRTPEQLRTSVWHMLEHQKPQMPHFRYLLTQAQVESIIEFLKRH